jgi:hypothetical protein
MPLSVCHTRLLRQYSLTPAPTILASLLPFLSHSPLSSALRSPLSTPSPLTLYYTNTPLSSSTPTIYPSTSTKSTSYQVTLTSPYLLLLSPFTSPSRLHRLLHRTAQNFTSHTFYCTYPTRKSTSCMYKGRMYRERTGKKIRLDGTGRD